MLLSSLRQSVAVSPVGRPCRRVCFLLASRSFSTTPAYRSSLSPEPPSLEETVELEAATSPHDPQVESEEDVHEERQRGMGYERFLSTIGVQYKYAKPNNWLGGRVPFPMNPSFKPPPPTSDAVRQELYIQFMQDPVENSVRKLAVRYNLSVKRVDAILRLKGLEHSWYKETSAVPYITKDMVIAVSTPSESGKQVQYGFQRGMEKLLGVRQRRLSGIQKDTSRRDVMEADSLEQDENRDAQRQRYQRHYWESVPENGQEPIVPASLEHGRNFAQKIVKIENRQKSTHPLLMPRFQRTKHLLSPRKPKLREKKDEESGRPAVEIRDVGGRFLDVKDRLQRIIESHRSARVAESARTSEGRQAKFLKKSKAEANAKAY